ncbi:MAG: tryptophan-rich sensory protein [Oscillospiraceae bacterium]|nr:tryptophan-rich sensory protein [Oscillospiraceae bacterium]
MNFKKWKPYIFWILLAEGVGLLAGLLTREATMIYANTIQKPPLSPPAIVFPVVWTILYALMGIGAARVATSPNRTDEDIALNLFIIQLIVNFFWSFFFFNAQAFGFAAIWLILLWVLVLLMIIAFWKVDRLAAWLQIPYLIWLTFAAYLNFGVYLLN